MTTFPNTSGMTTEQLSQAICEWFDDPLNKASYAAIQRTVEKLTNYHAPHGFMLEDFNLLCGMVSDELHKDRAEVRRDALLEACQAQCYYCRNGYEVELKSGINYVHKAEGRVFTDCNASLIRYKLLAADQGQGKE